MRITVKVGTSTLTHATGRLNIQRIEKLCKVLSDLKNAGHEIILVSSGAIGMGVGKLNLPGRPADMPGKQAAAAVGQCELIYTYDKLFGEYNHTVAQLLLTGEDIKNGQRSQNVRNTLTRLLELGALPVINENDAVAITFTPWLAAPAPPWAQAAWLLSSMPLSSPPRQAAKWSFLTAASLSCSTTLLRESPWAQDF